MNPQLHISKLHFIKFINNLTHSKHLRKKNGFRNEEKMFWVNLSPYFIPLFQKFVVQVLKLFFFMRCIRNLEIRNVKLQQNQASMKRENSKYTKKLMYIFNVCKCCEKESHNVCTCGVKLWFKKKIYLPRKFGIPSKYYGTRINILINFWLGRILYSKSSEVIVCTLIYLKKNTRSNTGLQPCHTGEDLRTRRIIYI